MILSAVILLIVLIILGLPLFAGILAATLLGLYVIQVDFMAIPIEVFRLANAPVLLAIPLFTFAGYLLGESGTAKRLVAFQGRLWDGCPAGSRWWH